jgi:hypothetical protein
VLGLNPPNEGVDVLKACEFAKDAKRGSRRGGVRRVKLSFASDVEVEFCDRGRALQQVEELARRGTRFPIVVFGPEGCGKTAWLKQTAELLRELGYEAIYVDPMRRDFVVCTDVKELVEKFAEAASEAIGVAQLKLAILAIDAIKWLVSKWRRGRVAVLVDDAFQAIGRDVAWQSPLHREVVKRAMERLGDSRVTFKEQVKGLDSGFFLNCRMRDLRRPSRPCDKL